MNDKCKQNIYSGENVIMNQLRLQLLPHINTYGAVRVRCLAQGPLDTLTNNPLYGLSHMAIPKSKHEAQPVHSINCWLDDVYTLQAITKKCMRCRRILQVPIIVSQNF